MVSLRSRRFAGAAPPPETGHFSPQYDDAAIARVSAALEKFSTIYLKHAPQQAIIARIEQLRRRTLGKRGSALPGLRLSQLSQAGKSKMLDKYQECLAATRAEWGLPPKPHQIIKIGLEKSISLKGVFQSILIVLGDTHYHRGTEVIVKQRVREYMLKLEVELLIIDEVQHLRRAATDLLDVTDAIKRFLDDGIVPCVLVGNEDSLEFFDRNQQLASRLGVPLNLSPLDPRVTREAVLFKSFCVRLDEAMVAKGVTKAISALDTSQALNVLFAASGGHIGRVIRVIEAALEHAAQRDAQSIELFDVSFALDNFAIPQGYLSHNPLRDPHA